jgi:hypothetical protein
MASLWSMKRKLQKIIGCLELVLLPLYFGNVMAEESKKREEVQNSINLEQNITDNEIENSENQDDGKFSLFDINRFQISSGNTYSRLGEVNSKYDEVGNIFGVSFRNWDSIDKQILEISVHRDLNRYFTLNAYVFGSEGELRDSETGYLNSNVRLRDMYSYFMMASNTFFYPISYNRKGEKPKRLIDPFIGLGIFWTLFNDDFSIKVRNKRYSFRIHNKFNGKAFGVRSSAGFDLNLGYFSKKLTDYGINFTLVYSFNNRIKGHSRPKVKNIEFFGRKIKEFQINSDFKRGQENLDINFGEVSFGIGFYKKF